jgi:hypothetical protein
MRDIIWITFLLAIFPWHFIQAQNNPKQDTETSQSSIEASLEYASNSDIYGIFNNFSIQPVSSANFIFSGERGLSLALSGMLYGNSNATSNKFSPEVDLTGGWDFVLLDEALIISPSYSHFIFASGATNAKSIYSDQTELALNGNFSWFKPSFSADYLFGKKSAMNFKAALGACLKLESVFKKGNSLQFDPSIGANYGNLSHAITIPKVLLQNLTTFRASYGDQTTFQQLLENAAVIQKKGISKQLANFVPSANLGQLFSATPANFQVNSVDISIPVSYHTKNLAISSGILISEPMHVPVYLKSNTIVYFSAGLTYDFDL